MKIDPKICREYMLSMFDKNHPYKDSWLVKSIRDEIEIEQVEKIQIEDEFIRVYLIPGGNNIFWTIEYKEYCNFLKEKRKQKLERIIDDL